MDTNCKIKIESHTLIIFFKLKPWYIKAVEKGFTSAFNLGPILGYSIISCSFKIFDLTVERGTSETIVSSAIIAGVQVRCILMNSLYGLTFLTR